MTERLKQQLRVGPQTAATGSDVDARASYTGAIVTTPAHGRFAEAARRGKIMLIDSDSITLAAAFASKGAGGTIKFINGFYNPANSGVNCEILRSRVATVSGTPGGPFFYNFLGAASTATPTGTVRNALLGGGSSAVQALVNVAVAIGGATTAFSQLAVLGGPAAIAAGAGIYDAIDEPDGSIIVPPGTCFGITCLAAGTTHIVQSTLMWEEVPIAAGQ